MAKYTVGKYKRKVFFNMSSGIITQVIMMILGLVYPRLFIEQFGSNVNGFVSSINQMYSYLILLESGVGIASLQALYSPVKDNDTNKINGILAASNNFYKSSSKFYLIAVIVVSVVYPLTVGGELPLTQKAYLTLITGLTGLLRFRISPVRINLIKAEGKEYIVSYFTSVTTILILVVKIILLNFNLNIMIIQSTEFFITLIQLIALMIFFKRRYKAISFKSKPLLESLSQKNSVLVHQISSLIFSSTDILVLTYFTNFTVVSVYAIFNTISNSVTLINTQISNAFTFILGQSIDDKGNNISKIYDLYEQIFVSFSFAITITMYLLFLPFLELYTINFENNAMYLDNSFALLFSIKLALIVGRTPARQLIDTAGFFRGTQRQSVVESVVNIISSLIFVNIYGAYGVLLGTIIALVYRTTDMIIFSNKQILKRSPVKHLIKWGIHLAVFTIIVVVQESLNVFTISIDNIIEFFIYAFVIFISLFLLNVLVDYVFFPKYILELKRYIKQFF